MANEKKSKRAFLLILLAAILVVLTVVIVLTLTAGEDPPPVSTTTTPQKVLLQQSPYSSISAISYTLDGQTLAFRSVGGTWQYTEDPQFPLNAAKIVEMMGKAAAITATAKVADTCAALADFGLDAPKITVRLTVDDADTVLHFGVQNYLRDNAYYGMLEGDPALYLFDPSFVEPFTRPLAAMAVSDSLPILTEEEVTAYDHYHGTDPTPVKQLDTASEKAAVSAVLNQINAVLGAEDLSKFASYFAAHRAGWEAEFGIQDEDSDRLTIRYVRKSYYNDENGQPIEQSNAYTFSLCFGKVEGGKRYLALQDSSWHPHVYRIDSALAEELLALFAA